MLAEILRNPTMMYLIVGLLTGILGATFGVGGGILMVPALTILASMPQKEAQGVSLTTMIVLAVMGSIRYHANPNIQIDWRAIVIMSITVVIGANVGASLAAYVSGKTLKIGFAILLFVAGGQMIWSAFRSAQ